MNERLLFKCTDGNPTCEEYYNCIDIIARTRVHCGERSQECRMAADGKGEKRRKTMSERKLEMIAELSAQRLMEREQE